MRDDRPRCPRCGSRMCRHGWYVKKDGTRIRHYWCLKCGRKILATRLKTQTEKKYKCPRCGAELHKRRWYVKADGSKIRRYWCPRCGRRINQTKLERIINESSDGRPNCPKCGRPMRKKGYYRLKDGTKVSRFYCGRCRVWLNIRGRKVVAKKKKWRYICLESVIGGAATRCIYCGSDHVVRNGHAYLRSGIRLQIYLCRKCGKTFRWTSRLREEIKKFYPRCPHCGSKSVWRNGSRRGKQRFFCRSCGRTFYATQHLDTLARHLGYHLREFVWKNFFVIADTIISAFVDARRLSRKVALSLAWGVRKYACSLSYRRLEALLRSPAPFTIGYARDENSVWRSVLRLDLAVLSDFIGFTYRIAENLATIITQRQNPNKLRPSLVGIDSTLVTLVGSSYQEGFGILKFHIYGDLRLGVIGDIELDWGVSDLPVPTAKDFAFVFGDSEYYNGRFLQRILREGYVPVIRIKGSDSSCSAGVLCVYRWLYRRYVRFLYRWRGIVESLVASSASHTNALLAKSVRGGIIEVMLRCAVRNIFVVGVLLLYFAEFRLGVKPHDVFEFDAGEVYIDGTCPINRYHTMPYSLLLAMNYEQ